MERERPTPDNGRAPALGEVARGVLDHAAVIVRDELKIGRLEARRYAEHVRREVAPRAAVRAAAGALVALAVVCGLVALFLGIAGAIGSVAWTFAIYAAFFAVVAVAVAAVGSRQGAGRPR